MYACLTFIIYALLKLAYTNQIVKLSSHLILRYSPNGINFLTFNFTLHS